jgi:hypothetical protein
MDTQRLETFRAAVAGRPVTDRHLAASALAIWIDTRPDDAKAGFVVSLGPTWQVRGPSGVVAGSRQAADDENLSGWAAVPAEISAVVGKSVEALDVDAASGELTLLLGGGFALRTFNDDPRARDGWSVKNLATGEELTCAPAPGAP